MKPNFDMMEYTVTIAMPVYNVQAYIRRSMESALSQTFESIEFLIIDDCGTDASIDIVREMLETHPRGQHIRIVRQPRNMGVGEARNRAMDEARGRYLYFMDADDTIQPNTIETLHEALVRHGAEVCFGSYEQTWDFKDDAKSNIYQYPDRVFYSNDSFGNFAFRKYDGIQTSSWNILFDMAFLRNSKLRFLPVNYWEDMAFMMCLPTCVSKAVTLSAATYHYCCRYNSLSNFQQRESIQKSEIEKTANAIETTKQATSKYSRKGFYPNLLNKQMMTDFYIACAIIRHRQTITPPFSTKEIRNLMHSPLSLTQILRHKQKKWQNLFLFMLGMIPPSISVAIIKKLGKKKGLI